MYTVKCINNGVEMLLYDVRDDDYMLVSPKLSLKDNAAGSFTFTILPCHPQYDNIIEMHSVIKVFRDGVEKFSGRPTQIKSDFNNRKNVYCEGELNYLVDSIQRQNEYHDVTVRGFLESLIANHNAQVEPAKHFTVGTVTVTDSNNSLYRYTNYETTKKCIEEKLIKRLGGHLRLRVDDNVRYIDYLADYPHVSTQTIEFGKNLLNYAKNIDASDIATAIIPLGAELEQSSIEALGEKLTITSVNGGCDYVYNANAVSAYGWIFKTVEFEDVTVPSNLLDKAVEYLESAQFERMVLELNALDMHDVDIDVEDIELLDMIRVTSAPHGLNRMFPVTELNIALDSPSSNKLKLGEESLSSMIDHTLFLSNEIKRRLSQIPSIHSLTTAVNGAVDAAITAATHGSIITTGSEQLIMESSDILTAQNVLRWNTLGLSASTDGADGIFSPVIGIDGHIDGSYISSGTVSEEALSEAYVTAVEGSIQQVHDAVQQVESALPNYATTTAVLALQQQVGQKITANDVGNLPDKVKMAFNQIASCVDINDTENALVAKDDGGNAISRLDADGISMCVDASACENVVPAQTQVLPLINSIELVAYDRANKHTSIGMIANQIESLMPEVVTTVNGKKSIKIADMLCYLIKAIQEL